MDIYQTKYLEKLKGSRPDRLIICGMGGSGLPGEIIDTFKTELGITSEITIWKDYGLPQDEAQSAKRKAQNTLYVFVSFSGDTEETISSLKAALKIKNAKVAVITGGGELKKIAETHKLPLAVINRDSLTSREATAIMFTKLVEMLESFGVISRTLPIPKPKNYKKSAANIMRFIDKGIPLMYTSHQLKSLAHIWKVLLNETAKVPAFENELPELDHNEIVSYESRLALLRPIFIEDPSDPPIIKKRVNLTKKIIKGLSGRTLVVKLSGKNRFERFWNGVYLGEETATLLAAKEKVDPKRTRSIDTLKAWLKKR